MARSFFNVEGLREIDRRLALLPGKVQSKVLRTAVKEAAAPVVTAAKGLAPAETGTLRRSIGVRFKNYRRSGSVVAVVGPRLVQAPKFRKGLPTSKQARDPRFYGHLVESGSEPHTQKGVVLAGFIRLLASQHPGARAQPFMEAAWSHNQGRLIGIMKRELKRGIDQELAKL